MPTLTIRDVPVSLMKQLKERAEDDRRSVTQEVIHLLEIALAGGLLSPAAQAEQWLRMGRWKSKQSAPDEIAAIYRARSGGRSVKP
jgi:plasmid stability protein